MGGEDTVLRNICTVIAPPGADLPFQATLYKVLAVYPEVTGGGMLVLPFSWYQVITPSLYSTVYDDCHFLWDIFAKIDSISSVSSLAWQKLLKLFSAGFDEWQLQWNLKHMPLSCK